jgi:formylglycine-generating enzyme required for sulfatase activity
MKLVKTLIAIAAIGVGSQAFGGVLSLGLNPTLELEPNNDTSSANKYQIGELYGGYISTSTVDYYSFTTIGGDGNYTLSDDNENVRFTIINQGGEILHQTSTKGGIWDNTVLHKPLRLASGSYYLVVTCEEGVGNEYVFALNFPDGSSQSASDSFSGWNYHAWPWVYSAADKDWLYYYCGSNGWAVWRHKDEKWYSFDEVSKAWVVLPGQEDVQEDQQVPTANNAGDTYTVQGAANLEMIWVEPGTFTMGSPTSEPGRYSRETQHEVTLTKGFYLGKYEVTQAQWERVMGSDPSHFNGANRPVEKVSWNDVTYFCEKLTEVESEAGRLPDGMAYQLPTEAQWEYACRAGTTTAYSWGNSITDSNANYRYNIGETRDVGQYAANPWGLFDMHGNVLEWCADWYADYPSGPAHDPVGPAGGSGRVERGGSWLSTARFARSADRNGVVPANSNINLGFRLSLRPPASK